MIRTIRPNVEQSSRDLLEDLGLHRVGDHQFPHAPHETPRATGMPFRQAEAVTGPSGAR